jgi:hypothetical protein
MFHLLEHLMKSMKSLSLLVLCTLSAAPTLASTTPAVESICTQPENGDGVAQLRAKYVCEIENYLPLVKASLSDTEASIEEQAKTLSQLRREIGSKYKNLTPQWLRNMVYCRNQKVYKDPLGPTYEAMLQKGKSNEEIANSAIRTGGKDLLLDNVIAVQAVDWVNYLHVGNAIEQLWSWLPGDACGQID